MNNQKYIYLDLFSGVGGFHLGLERAGFKFSKTYFSEIDKHSIAVYKHKFKNAEYVGPVENVSGIERPNIITFGSPCQDFSVAGKQKGLDGERSSLIEYAIRLVAKYKPDFFIWENVKGAFSSNNGADFWAIIQAFANIRDYRLEWQLLDTAWLIPQHRERIYLVGHLAGRSAPGVFPFRESDSEFNQKHGHTTESEIASTLQSPGNAYGNYKGMNAIIQKTGDYTTTVKENITGTLQAGGASVMDKVPNVVIQVNPSKESNGVQPYQQNRVYSEDGVLPALNSELSGRNNIEVKPVLTPDRKEKRQNGRRFKEDGEPAFTLNTQDQHGVQIDSNIRRLTETECSRLQGFPDTWNEYGNYDGTVKKVSKTQRYRQMGNAVTVDIVEMVGKRIIEKCIK